MSRLDGVLHGFCIYVAPKNCGEAFVDFLYLICSSLVGFLVGHHWISLLLNNTIGRTMVAATALSGA